MWTVFDIDGCLSDDRPRRHLLEARDYQAYHSAMSADQPINLAEWAVAEARVVITARPERYRDQTLRWLRKNFPGDFELLMRPYANFKESPELKVTLLRDTVLIDPEQVSICYDDREDVVQAYRAAGYSARRLGVPSSTGVPAILEQMAATFRERNEVYRDNYKRVPAVVSALFPRGVPGALVLQPQWHLFELILVKLARFANTDLTHEDSIHDVAVYAAMIQSILEEQQ